MKKDITGQRFGKLTVLREDLSWDGYGVKWICQCDCGSPEKSISANSLLRKNRGVKSCGCMRNSPEAFEKSMETKSKGKSDLTGMRFGRLTVLNKSEERVGKARKVAWDCICDCGNYRTIVGESLKNGSSRSCGCYYTEIRKEIAKEYNEYDLESYSFGVGYDSKGKEFYFDKEDYDKIKKYKWNCCDYVQAHTSKLDESEDTKIIRLHRLILGVDTSCDLEVDHINHDTYDNRKSNLRLATRSQNTRNQERCHKKYKKNKNGTYSVLICIHNRIINLGTFNTEQEAIDVRLKAEHEYYGEFVYNQDVEKITL